MSDSLFCFWSAAGDKVMGDHSYYVKGQEQMSMQQSPSFTLEDCLVYQAELRESKGLKK